MLLECVQVCVDYADYLAATLPFNKGHFDRTIVVTTPADTATQRVCRHYNVECLVTDVLTPPGEPFNKGAGIDLALRRLDFSEWAVHLDADIALPPLFRTLLEQSPLNEQCLYSADRAMVPTWLEWQRFLAAPQPQHERSRCLPPERWPIGYRLTMFENGLDGYLPVGYFQLFHRTSRFLGRPFYPITHSTAAGSDLEFAARWPRKYRQLLPEIIVYHLAAGDASDGANWEGRKTPRFGPPDV
jgi:hypothetical protein